MLSCYKFIANIKYQILNIKFFERQKFNICYLIFAIFNLSFSGCALFPTPLPTIAQKTPSIQSFSPGNDLTQPTGWTDVLILSASDLQGDALSITWSVSGTLTAGTLTRITDSQYQYTAPLAPGNVDTITVLVSDGTFTNTYTATITVPKPSDPASPNNLSISGSSSSAALVWNANTESNLSGYVIARATADIGPYAVVGSTNASQLYYVDTDTAIQSGGPYFYTVQAYNSSHSTSNYSSRPSLSPSGLYVDSSAPNQPVITASSAGERAVTFSLTDLGDADGLGQVLAYDIWMCTDNVNFSLLSSTTNFTAGGTLSFSYDNLVNASSYFYQVVAIDLAGRRNTSNTLSLSPNDQAPAAPTGVTVNATVGALLLNWTANAESDLAGYWIYRTSTDNAEVNTSNAVTVNASIITATNYTDTGVSSNTSYHYRLKAADSDGDPSSLLSDFSDNITYTAPEIYTQIDSIGTSGSSLGEFSSPSGIAVDSSGRIYVSDTKNSRIQVFDSSGTALTSVSGTLRLPGNLSVKSLSSNVVLMATDQTGVTEEKIYQYFFDGTVLTLQAKFGEAGTATDQLTEGFGIGFNSSYLYVSEINHSAGEKIVRYNYADLTYSSTFGGADNGDSSYGNSEFYEPRDIELDSSGTVYVTDTLHSRLVAYDSAGAYQFEFGTASSSTNNAGDTNIYLKDPEDMTVYESGIDRYFYIADTGNDRIVKLHQVGSGVEFVTSFGSTGSGDNQLSNPTGVAISPDGLKIYVVDQGNNRILVFQN